MTPQQPTEHDLEDEVQSGILSMRALLEDDEEDGSDPRRIISTVPRDEDGKLSA